MVTLKLIVFATVTFVILVRTDSKPQLTHEEKVAKFLKNYNEEMSRLNYERNVAKFDYNTNMTKYNEKLASDMDLLFSKRNSKLRTKAGQFDLNKIMDQSNKRQLELLLVSATAKDPLVTKRLNKVQAQMKKIYSEAHVPYSPKYIKTIKTDKDVLRVNQVAQIFATSTDANELLYCWKEWRNSIGPKITPLFTEMVSLLNQGARDNGFPNEAEFRKFAYEVDDLEEVVLKFWSELKPMYEELHGYIRHRLTETYPDLIDERKGIPAHLLGNLWTTNWAALANRVKLFPDESGIQVTPKLVEKNYNVSEIIRIAEKFFVSLGWPKLSESFWKRSVFTQPENIQMICQPAAYDMGAKFDDIPDIRMTMCGTVNEYYFNTVHHELGHVYYFMFYADLPFDFRQGANPGFHEAIGDALMLSAKTPLYLKSIGLIDQANNSTASNLNFLMTSALRTIAFLPYGALMDIWRWEIFKGNIKPEDYNRKWWELRLKYQGILPPAEGEDMDLDGAAKFHIAWDIPYIRYFFSTIFQFSFYAQACKDAGYEGPLHLCSLENSKEAGQKLRKMLELGKSKKWPEILKQYTGSSEISAEPLIQYFKPLLEWLKKERKRKNYTIGWDEKLPVWSNAIMIKMNFLLPFLLVILIMIVL